VCTSENEKKKAYLRRYRANKRKEEKFRQEIEALEVEYGLQSPKLDKMPRGSEGKDLSVFAVRYDAAYTHLLRIAGESLRIYKEISEAIENSECSETESCILRYRYINGYTWEMIAVEMHYSYQWVCELHGRALQHFSIPLDCN